MKIKIITQFSICILLLSALLISITPSAFAQDYVFGSNIRINDDSSNGAQRTPNVAVSDNGNVYVIWTDERNGNKDIMISKSTDDGRLFGDLTENNDIRVDNDPTTTSQTNPVLDTYNNDLYATWFDDRSNYYHIYFAKSTNNGDSFGNNVKVDSQALDVVCQYPDIAVSSSGLIGIVWQQSTGIYYSESTDGGNSFITSIQLNDTGKYPKIAFGSSGDKYITWEANSNIYFTSAASDSTSFTKSIQIDGGTNQQTRPSIATYGISTVYIVWRDERDGSSGDIYFDKSTDKGVNWGTDKRVESTNKGAIVQDRPDIAVDAGGNIHIVWEDLRSSNRQIYYANSTDGGSTFGTNIRVDDSQSNIEGREPSIDAGKTNKVYVTWKDNRNLNNDIYFSRWGLASQMGYPPKLTEPSLSKSIGGIGDSFKYEVIYTDLDNDEVDPSYPKLHIYTDHSKTSEISGSPFLMKVIISDDSKPASLGKKYSKSVVLNQEHEYAYWIEARAIEGDQTLAETDLIFGPKIDNTPPIYSKPTPSSNKWINSKSVDCTIQITDPGGSGVDKSKIMYKYITNGSSEYSRFYTNPMKSQINDGFSCKATITFTEGAENFIVWNATDTVASGEDGYVHSEAYEVKVDTTPVTFTDPVPLDINWQNSESVTCSITINDFSGSFVNGSSIRYYYLPTGTANYVGPFSASVAKVDETIVATTPTPVPFYNGPGNSIKWEASDVAGNSKISDAFEVNIDTSRPDNVPPSAPDWIKPDNSNDKTPTIEWAEAYDSDNDDLTYFIQIGTYSEGDDVLSWTSTGSKNFYIIKNDMLIGTYYVQVQAFDDLDYSPIISQTMNITASGTNNLPSPPTSILPKVTTSYQPYITWSGANDPDSDPLLYFIQIGTSPEAGDVIPWTAVGKNEYYTPTKKLSDGLYYVQVLASDGSGTSIPYYDLIKIATFQPELDVPSEATAYQGDASITVKIDLKNNGTMSDNITINITGSLLSKSSVTLTLKPASPLLLKKNESESIKLTISLPSQITLNDYPLEIQAISEDGESKSFSYTLMLHVKKKDASNGDGPNNGDTEEEDENPLSALLPMIILLIVIVVIIVVLAAAVSSSKKKKESEKDKEAFFREQDEYDKLYGKQNR
jgi:hypothetical protein